MKSKFSITTNAAAVLLVSLGLYNDTQRTILVSLSAGFVGLLAPFLIPWKLFDSLLHRFSFSIYYRFTHSMREASLSQQRAAGAQLWREDEADSVDPYENAKSVHDLIPQPPFRDTLFWLQLEKLLPLIIRDFVHSWYNQYIGYDPAVPELAQEALLDIAQNLVERAAVLDRAALATELIDITQEHFHRVLHSQRHTATDDEAVARFEDLTLHPATAACVHPCADSDIRNRRSYFTSLAEELLLTAAPQDLLLSGLARHVLATSLATCLLNPTVISLSDPDYIRQCLVLIIQPLVAEPTLSADHIADNDAEHNFLPDPEADRGHDSDDGYDNTENVDNIDNIDDADNIDSTDNVDSLLLPRSRAQIRLHSIDVQSVYSMDGNESSPYRFTVSVTGYRKLQRYAEYEIEVWHVLTPEEHESPHIEPWAVQRRYRDFARLHSELRRHYPRQTRHLTLPARALRQTFVPKLDDDLLDSRCQLLDAYLQEVIGAGLGATAELKDFLSSTTGQFSEESRAHQPWQMQRAAKAGLGSLSKAFRTLAWTPLAMAMRPFRPTQDDPPPTATSEMEFVRRRLTALQGSLPFDGFLTTFESTTTPEPIVSLTKFKERPTSLRVAPKLIGLFLEVFKPATSRWTSSTLTSILSRCCSGMVDGFMDDTLDALTTDYSIATYIVMLKETFWPLGVFQEEPTMRSPEQVQATMDELKRDLDLLLPSLISLLLGKRGYQDGLNALIATVSIEKLNRHLVLRLIDTVVARLCVAADK
eukprot:m.144473 g.144473  ORF g.144473 m.144473 type:complete len:761 (+) comp16198_c0_seq2:153-2435(+)